MPKSNETATPERRRDREARLRAYLQRGSVPGHELDDWLEAEAELSSAAATRRPMCPSPWSAGVRTAARRTRPSNRRVRVAPARRTERLCTPLPLVTRPAPCNSKPHGWTRRQAHRPRSGGRHPGGDLRRRGAAARARARRAGACCCAATTRCSRSARPAPTTAARSPRGCSCGDTVRCPWHHACFDLRTGAPVRAPALNPIPCYEVARHRRPDPGRRARRAGRSRCAGSSSLRTIAIVGAGAAGESAAETLAPRGLRRRDPAVRRRRVAAGRPPQPVEGLPGGHRARGVDAAAPARVLRRAEDRADAGRARREHRPGRPQADAGGRARRRAGTRCCWRPAPSRCGRRCPAATSRTC